jgi:hypothetical protein
MLETAFKLFEKKPEDLKDRLVAPYKYVSGSSPYLYLFNYSAAPVLKKSALTGTLIKRFSKDILSQNATGLACITVSEEGVRIAKRFGMIFAGYFYFDGNREGVYTTRCYN